MKTKRSGVSPAGTSTVNAERVGSAEFRGNLAKYLRQAKSGRPVIVQERGKSAYLLLKFEEPESPSVFGCMRQQTEYVAGSIYNADEKIWRKDKLS